MRTCFSLTPKSCNRRMVRLRWGRRAAALRSCVNVNWAAIVWARWGEHRPPGSHRGSKALVAVRNWARVRPSLFSPLLLAELGEEKRAHAGQEQMPLNGDVPANLKVIQAQFVLGVLEHSFDAPSRERHQQQGLDRNTVGSIAQEELDLTGFEHVPSEQQVIGSGGQAVLVLDPYRDALGLPHHRSLLSVFHTVAYPRHPTQLGRVNQYVTHLAGGRVSNFQTRPFPKMAALSLPRILPLHYLP